MASPSALERRTLRVLVAAQVFGGAGFFIGIAVIALLARDVSGSEALSGLGPAMTVAAAALGAIPLSALMDSAGRRPGLVAGYCVGATGAVVVLAAAAADSFLLLCAGLGLFGFGWTASLLSRYAGADLSPAERRARAMSTVLFATAAGAILGPNLASAAESLGDPLGVPDRAGAFAVSAVAFLAAAAVVFALLRPDPLLIARRLGEEPVDAADESVAPGSPLTLMTSGAAGLGLSAMLTANLVMTGIMTMTPLQLVDHGETLSVVGIVVSVHVAGMFLPSPLTGRLADRLGRLPVIRASAVVLLGAGVLAGAGHEATVLVGIALVLLGVGWNLGLIGGSALLTDAVPVDARPRVQGRADLAMGLAGATGGAGSGIALGAGGFVLLAALGAGFALVLLAATTRRTPTPRPVG